jgi:N-acetylglutamate synthase-like GNAT family acetyltransferase
VTPLAGQFHLGKSISLWRRGVRSIRRLADTWYPWNQKKLQKRLQPLVFRQVEDTDLRWCHEMLRRNESSGVPPNGWQEYHEYITSGESLTVVAENAAGVRVGTFGLHWLNETVCWLSYVLVEPDSHRGGIGSTMLIAALSLLKRTGPDQMLMLAALETSERFYRQFGFISLGIDAGRKDFVSIQLLLGPICPLLVMDCSAMLTSAAATIPDLSGMIPLRVPSAPLIPEPSPSTTVPALGSPAV